MIAETETQFRLRRAKADLEVAVAAESEARRALRRAEDTRRMLQERVNDLFLQEEQEEVKRRKSEYRHCTL